MKLTLLLTLSLVSLTFAETKHKSSAFSSRSTTPSFEEKSKKPSPPGYDFGLSFLFGKDCYKNVDSKTGVKTFRIGEKGAWMSEADFNRLKAHKYDQMANAMNGLSSSLNNAAQSMDQQNQQIMNQELPAYTPPPVYSSSQPLSNRGQNRQPTATQYYRPDTGKALSDRDYTFRKLKNSSDYDAVGFKKGERIEPSPLTR